MEIRYKIFEIEQQLDFDTYGDGFEFKHIIIEQKESYSSETAAIQHLKENEDKLSYDDALGGKEITILPTIRF